MEDDFKSAVPPPYTDFHIGHESCWNLFNFPCSLIKLHYLPTPTSIHKLINQEDLFTDDIVLTTVPELWEVKCKKSFLFLENLWSR